MINIKVESRKHKNKNGYICTIKTEAHTTYLSECVAEMTAIIDALEKIDDKALLIALMEKIDRMERSDDKD